MRGKTSTKAVLGISAAVLAATVWTSVKADSTDYTGDPKSVPGANGTSGSDLNLAFFAIADQNVDNKLSRAELKATMEKFLTDADTAKAGSVTVEQLTAGVKFRQPQLPQDSHVKLMEAALPAQPAAKPLKPRKVLIMDHCGGFIHTAIPLTGTMIKEFGDKNKTWTTTISYDPADINEANLKQYDAIILNSTTGKWLDDPNSATVTEARHKALLDFVRSGKGLVGIHGAGDSYHAPDPTLAAERAAADGQAGRAGRAGGGGGNRAAGPAATIAEQVVAQGDKNGDKKVDKAEVDAVADAWYDKLDTAKTNAVGQTEFLAKIGAVVVPNPAPRGARAGGGGGGEGRGATAQDMRVDIQRSLWPDYSRMIGGFFKFHFPDTLVTLKIDDPSSPLTTMYKGLPPVKVYGEVYTFLRDHVSMPNV